MKIKNKNYQYQNIIKKITKETNAALQAKFEGVPLMTKRNVSNFIGMFRERQGLSEDEFVYRFNRNEKVTLQAIETAATNIAIKDFNAKLLN